MQGLMQDWPLLVHTILDHARNWHGSQEIVSRTIEGPIHRYNYVDLDRRARQIASAVRDRLEVGPGDVVATMAWNGYRHLETWYGVMGLGAIVHTLNPRLFADQLTYIVNHADDEVIFVDKSLLGLLAPLLPTFERLISRGTINRLMPSIAAWTPTNWAAQVTGAQPGVHGLGGCRDGGGHGHILGIVGDPCHEGSIDLDAPDVEAPQAGE